MIAHGIYKGLYFISKENYLTHRFINKTEYFNYSNYTCVDCDSYIIPNVYSPGEHISSEGNFSCKEIIIRNIIE